MKRFYAIGLLAAALFWAVPGLALSQVSYQRAPFASTPNPVGSGGRAVAWGGAFIAVADDATAANWNPAGLVQLVLPEASVALSYHSRWEDVSFSGYDAESESRVGTMANLNYASAVYPFNVKGVNMVVSVSYQRLFDFDRDLEYTAEGVLSGRSFEETRTIKQGGALTTVTPAYAIQITPEWSMGVAVNFWGLEPMGNGWNQQWEITTVSRDPVVPSGNYTSWSATEESYTVTGVNYVIGTHFKIQNLTVGAVYKSGFEGNVEYENDTETASYFPLSPTLNSHFTTHFEDDQTLTWPESYGFGLAYRYSDEFSFAVDAYTIRWSQFKLDVGGESLNLLAGDDQTADIQDTWQVRAGAEYLFIMPTYVVAARCGAFYDPEPLSDEVNDFYGVALGGGIAYQSFIVDAALQYRWAQDVKGEQIKNVQAETDVSELMGIVSLIYHFE